jgi:Ala-tRNA(Pro) deacylase
MGKDVLEKIMSDLDKAKVKYEHLTHGRVHSSHEAARIRGNKVEQAAKAIVLKARGKKGGEFVQCVLPGHKKINLKKLKVILGVKNVGLASSDDVLRVTSCSIGSVPPFGGLFGLSVYADKSLLEEEIVVFSAGTHYDSIMLKSKDFIRVVNPLLEEFVE